MTSKNLFSVGPGLVGLGALLVGLGAALGFFLAPRVQDTGVDRSAEKLEDAFRLIDEHYVESVSANEIAEHGIEGMLGQLDPHSVYIGAEEMKQVRESFNAEFEGIGISYEFARGPDGQDTIAVLSVLAGGPSEEVGLLPGDRITAVAGSSAVGFTSAEVQRSLKGPEGTEVTVTVRRPGAPDRLDFTIERDEIPLTTVDAAYMVDDSTGYIKVNRFARTTYREFAEALSKLKGRGMERLMLDLRGNSGGYMSQAVRLADAFLPDDQEIVSQEGRLDRYDDAFAASGGGGWEQQPLMVLVDEHAASASEIVAGAVQDHDRALLVGRRTFGKGLVQKQFEMNDGSVMRLTIARYYTPAGRLIQTDYESGVSEEDYLAAKRTRFDFDATHTVEEILARAPDSLVYRTAHGRRVLGGGGILPDVLVHRDSVSAFARAVQASGALEAFARRWVDTHRPEHAQWEGAEAFRRGFRIDAAAYDEFLALAQQRGLRLSETPAPSATDSARTFSRAQAREAQPYLSTLIKSRIARRLFGQSALYPVIHDVDPLFQAAQTHWPDARQLAQTGQGEGANPLKATRELRDRLDAAN